MLSVRYCDHILSGILVHHFLLIRFSSETTRSKLMKHGWGVSFKVFDFFFFNLMEILSMKNCGCYGYLREKLKKTCPKPRIQKCSISIGPLLRSFKIISLGPLPLHCVLHDIWRKNFYENAGPGVMIFDV